MFYFTLALLGNSFHRVFLEQLHQPWMSLEMQIFESEGGSSTFVIVSFPGDSKVLRKPLISSSNMLSQRVYKLLLSLCYVESELESVMLSEISQAVRDKYHMISPLTGT